MTDRHWIDIGELDEIPRLGSRVVEIADTRIAVFRCRDDAVFALRDECPHKGGPLSQGIVHDHRVTCPLHNWVIDMVEGEAVKPDEGCVQRYAVEVEDGRVRLALSSPA